MKIPRGVLDQIQDLDYNNFHKIKDSELCPAYDLMGLKYLRDKAGNERNMRELYRNRAPYELLQNADNGANLNNPRLFGPSSNAIISLFQSSDI